MAMSSVQEPKAPKKQTLREVSEALVVNVLAATIYSVIEKAIPQEVWIAFVVNVVLVYYILSKINNIYIKHGSVLLIIIMFILAAISIPKTFYGSLPLSRMNSFKKYYHFMTTDELDSGNASLRNPVISDGKLILTIDRPDEINDYHVYVNIGIVYKNEDKYWLLESKFSDEFVNYHNSSFSVPISDLPFIGKEVGIYLTNKPKQNSWLKISNFSHPFYRKLKIGD